MVLLGGLLIAFFARAQVLTMNPLHRNVVGKDEVIREFKNFIIYKGDTLNRKDKRGRKDGGWVEFKKIYSHKTNGTTPAIDSTIASYVIEMQGYYNKGEKRGLWHSFYSNGRIKESIEYEDFNQVRELSRAQFKEFKKEGYRFIPSDLKNARVLMVRISVAETKELMRRACLAAILRQGYDTTSIAADINYLFENEGMTDEIRKAYGNSSIWLEKEGITLKTIENGDDIGYPINDYRYSLKMNIVTSMRFDSREEINRRNPYYVFDGTGKKYFITSWFTKTAFYFVDRTGSQYFDTFLPTNYSVFDLIGKKTK